MDVKKFTRHPSLHGVLQAKKMVADRIYMLLWQVTGRLFIHKLSALNTSIYKQHYSFVEKHLGCFNSLFIVNRLAVNITEQVSVE